MIVFLDPERLKSHERIDKVRLEELITDLKRKKVLRKPVVVDRKTLLILDGHHRRAAFVKLGIKKLPCFLVDYLSETVKVNFRRQDIKNKLIKEVILRKAKAGDLFPDKTTKHILSYRPVINYRL